MKGEPGNSEHRAAIAPIIGRILDGEAEVGWERDEALSRLQKLGDILTDLHYFCDDDEVDVVLGSLGALLKVEQGDFRQAFRTQVNTRIGNLPAERSVGLASLIESIPE